MKNYIYEPMWTQELEDNIVGDRVESLVAEMFYKYGLKAYACSTTFLANRAVIMLTYDGLPYCGVFIDTNKDSAMTYNYFSYFYSKDRGRDMTDRRTLSSTKLSSLMRTLEKKNAVPSVPEDLSSLPRASSVVDTVYNAYKTGYKSTYALDSGGVHTLLKYFNGDIPKSDMSQDFINKCKSLLDEFNIVDLKSAERQEGVREFFSNGVYLIGEDYGAGFIVNKVTLEVSMPDTENSKLLFDESFQRIKTIEEYEDYEKLAAQLTFLKVFKEDKEGSGHPNLLIVPRQDGYYEDINMAVVSTNGFNSFHPRWLVIPASK